MSLSSDSNCIPKGNLQGFKTYFKNDILSGFLVFLIALPLCLGIALASGYPAVAGIFTAIVGGLIATFLSNSELTIKGPAAGLIVIALGCVQEFGFTGGEDLEKDFQAYRLALGVGVVAGVYQIILGLFRVGILVKLFPSAAIHGLLASIGIIIISKQFPVLMGLSPQGNPLELLANIPYFIINMNPKIALIGILSMTIVLSYGYIKNPKLKLIPAPMLMLLIIVPMEAFFGIGVDGSYTFNNQVFELGRNFLVNVPNNLFNAVTLPDFSGITTETGIKYTVLFAIIGSLESILSAKAIDAIDPWNRKTNLDRDLLATGIANTFSAFIGGLPMISEIVRSKANIDNGAKTRFANFYHGMFLLICVALIPGVINQIPLAALAALLVITGYRLASPHEFLSIYREGIDQFIIFVSTILGVLATDLLKGLAIGIGVKIIIHFIRGGSIFTLNAKIIPERDKSITIFLRGSVIFSSWIPLKKHLQRFYELEKMVTLDITETKMIDRRVMLKIEEWQEKFKEKGVNLVVKSRYSSIDE